jgi:uncharacterized repeat protein (TIGR02543 family)
MSFHVAFSRLASAIALAAIACSSCSLFFKTGGNSDTVTVTIRDIGSYAKSAKTITFATPVVASYQLYGAQTGNAQALLDTYSSLGSATVTLKPGTWDFTLKGLDSSGNIILSGTQSGLAVSATVSTIDFTLTTLSDGTGNVAMTVTWPSSVSVASAKASYNGGSSASIAISGSSATYTNASAAAGDHLVNISLYDAGGNLMSSVFELVWVRNNLTSSKTIALAASDFNSPPAAPSALTAALVPSTSTSDTVNLSWNDNSDNETGFTLGYSNDGGTTWSTVALPPATTSYSDTSASRGLTRSYRVQATNSFGLSAWATSASSVTIPYLITFNYQESGVADSVVESNTDFTVTSPSAPTRSGYCFTGWFTQATGGTAWSFTSSKVSANTTLYAQWLQAGSATIGFTLNPSYKKLVPSPSATTIANGASVIFNCSDSDLSSLTWTWYQNNAVISGQTGSSYTFTPSAKGCYAIGCAVTFNGIAYSGSATVTVTDPLTVSYSGNGSTSGTVPAASTAYTSGATVTVLGNTGSLTKSAYSFTGWNTAADASGTTYAAGATFSMPSTSVTLYATWSNTAPAPVTNLKANGGSGYLKLSWTDPSDADLAYIQIVMTGTDGSQTYTVAKGAQTKLITGLSNSLTASDTFTVTNVGSGTAMSSGVSVTCCPALTRTVTVFAGSTTSGSHNGTGTSATFNYPNGIAADATRVFVADTGNNLIRQIVISTGAVTTIAGTGAAAEADGNGSAATFNAPTGLALLGNYLYVVDHSGNTIRRIDLSTGSYPVTTIAGSTTSGFLDDTGTAAIFNAPIHIATDGTYLYVTDYNNTKIRRIEIATANVTTIVSNFDSPWGIATDGTSLYVTSADDNKIYSISLATNTATPLVSSGLSSPRGLAVEGNYLIVAGNQSNDLKKVEISSRNMGIFAPSYSFLSPYAVAFNGSALFVADTYNHEIEVISP